MPYQLINYHISRDTVELAERILEGAQSGEVIGMTVGLMLKRRRYIVDVSGECVRDPTFARGMLGAIEDDLRSMVHDKSDSNTTI